MINNMVGMAGHREDQHQEMEYFQKFFRFMQMMMMMKKMMGGTKNNYYADETGSYKRNDDMGYQNKMDSMDSMFRSMGQMRFKRQAGDSLALNDRLKEKLEHMMKEHVEHVSNMTCVLRELNVID